MKMLLRSNLVAALIGVALTLYAQVAAAPVFAPAPTGWSKSPYVPGQVLVKFKSSAIAQDRAASIAALGHTLVADLNQSGLTQVRLRAGQTVDTALAAYKNNPSVEYAQPNYIYRASRVPNDTQYDQLWAFKNTGQTIVGANFPPARGTPGDDIHIEPAWGQITDCSSVIVAVVDTGVNYNQEDLASNMWNGNPTHGDDFVGTNHDPIDLNGHGTHVAGIIGAAGNNGKGTTGVCWTATIMAVRVLDSSGAGDDVTIINGISFAVANGAKIINMSLGGPGPGPGQVDQALSNAITSAQTADVVVAVAAGNDGANNDSGASPTYPCNFTQPNLICVAALDPNFALASFSNVGTTSVDVGAPGTNILSTYTGTTATMSDNLTSGWTFTTTTTGGWGFDTLQLSNGQPTAFLLDPANYDSTNMTPSVTYAASTDDRAYKTFNLANVSVATLNAGAVIDVMSGGDHFRTGYIAAGGDPFSGSGTILNDISGPVATFPNILSEAFDVSGCNTAACSIGFQLQSDGVTPKDRGLAITGISIDTLTLTTNTYQLDTGTSMATPMVAGLAAMLRAYNPQFTYVDTINAIKGGGKSVPALSNKTTTGKAIDVMKSLAFISTPTGLSAAVAP